jgi:hypothetical protein
MRAGLLCLFVGWLLGWIFIAPMHYDVSKVVTFEDQRAATIWLSRDLPHQRRGILDVVFPSKLSLAEYDFELAWESYDFSTQVLSREADSWVKVMCMEALTSFYQREQSPSDLDASLYARRRGEVLRLREQLIVNGMTSDWRADGWTVFARAKAPRTAAIYRRTHRETPLPGGQPGPVRILPVLQAEQG